MGPALIPLMAVGTLMQFRGQMDQAKAADAAGLNAMAASNYKAAQLRQNAGQQIAASQQARNEELRKAKLMASRALAVAGAGGGGASDPTVLNLIADIEGEGAYRGALDIYQGQDAARQMEQGALTSELEGQTAYSQAKSRSRAMKTQAWANLAMNTGSMFMKYGGGGVKPEQAPAPVEDRFFN